MSEVEYIKRLLVLLGERIKYIRIVKGYATQTEFAKVYTRTGEKSTIINRIENGNNLRFVTLVRIARAFNIKFSCLFDFKNEQGIIDSLSKLTLDEQVRIELRKLGKHILQIRKAKNLIQLDVQIEAFIDRANLSHYENGNRPLEFVTLINIARSLDISLFELFKEEERSN